MTPPGFLKNLRARVLRFDPQRPRNAMPFKICCRLALLFAVLAGPMALVGCGGGATTEIPATTPPPPKVDKGPPTAGPPTPPLKANR
jgi:hypothetical protein